MQVMQLLQLIENITLTQTHYMALAISFIVGAHPCGRHRGGEVANQWNRVTLAVAIGELGKGNAHTGINLTPIGHSFVE